MEQPRMLSVDSSQVIVVPRNDATEATVIGLAGEHDMSSVEGRTARVRDPSPAARYVLELCGLTQLVEA